VRDRDAFAHSLGDDGAVRFTKTVESCMREATTRRKMAPWLQQAAREDKK